MSSYFDYLGSYSRYVPFIGGTEYLYSRYKKAYQNSHGGNRYLLKSIPGFGQRLALEDAYRQQEDRYNNTGIDAEYVQRINNNEMSGLTNTVGSAVKMARSLSEVYTPEVVEDVGSKFNNSYW